MNRERLDAFLHALFAATYQNPLGRGRVFNNEALIFAYPQISVIHLSELRALQLRQGSGTRALQLITRLADEHGVELTLFPKRVGKEGMNATQLRCWYKQHGFVTDKNDRRMMRRTPKETK
jgi:hypothetical protein